MKEKDFDEIGKRLLNIEAEPPKNGWKRVGAALQTPLSGKVVWIKKFWWLPLAVLIPAALFYWYPSQDLTMPDAAEESISIAPSNEPIADSSSSQSEQENYSDESKKSEKVETTFSVPSKTATTTTTSEKIDIHSIANAEKVEAKKYEVSNTAPVKITVTSLPTVIENSIALPSSKSESIETIESKNTSTPDALNQQEKEPTASAFKEVVEPTDHRALSSNSFNKIDSATIEGSPQNRTLVKEVDRLVADSVSTTELQKEKTAQPTDSASVKADEIIKKKESYSLWRWSLAFAPQYVTRVVKPLANDEVFVTNVSYPTETKNIGYQVAAGMGKSITENLWLDAQLSYTSLQQDIFFSSNTGAVDTLLAELQADQTIRVTPVFEIIDREVKSKINYGGLRLSGTFYFWANARRRFNLQAAASTYYILKSNVQEKIDNRWTDLTSNNQDKLNFAMTIGGGYNLWLSQGWELMINPTLTYYLKEVKNAQLPYNVSQRTLGLNFTLSKMIK